MDTRGGRGPCATVGGMLEISATGARPIDETWESYVRPALWSTWAPQIRSVRCDDEVIVAGTRGVVHGPLLVRVPFTVESVSHADRSWAWRVGVGPLGVRMEHGVAETTDGVRAWARIHLPAAVALPYGPVARLALRRLVRTAGR